MLKNYICSHYKKNSESLEAKNHWSRVQFQLPEFRACMCMHSPNVVWFEAGMNNLCDVHDYKQIYTTLYTV